MNGRGADGIGGPIQEFWTARDIVGRVGVLGMVEGTQLIGHGRGRVGRAASMDSEMGQHVGVSSLQPRCVDLGVEMRGKAWLWSRPEQQQQQRPKPWGGPDQGQRAVKAGWCRCGRVVFEELLDIDATIASGRALRMAV